MCYAFAVQTVRGLAAMVSWRPWIDWVKAAMKARGLESLRQLAEYSEVSVSTLSENLKGLHRPSDATNLKLARYFGVDVEYLRALAGYEPRPGQPLPMPVTLGDITTGIVAPFIEVSAGGGYEYGGFELYYPPPGASRNLVFARVRGDCMAPRIESGDIVVVDRSKPWKDGQIVLARVENELLIKRAYRENSRIRLRADAPDCADVVDPSTVVLGVVIEIRKKPD